MKKTLLFFSIAMIASTMASADVCDYRPSKLISSGGAGVAGTASAATATAGAGMKAAGFYTLTHAASGATMLASTAGGASAAGTVGIMGGTAGAVGTVAAFLMSPIVITGAVIAAGSIAVVEGGCYIASK